MSLFSVNYFALFGLEARYVQNLADMKAGYLKLQQELHPDRFVGAAPQTKQLAVHYASEVNQAYQTLIDPVLRAKYMLKLRGIECDESNRDILPPEFLVEQMEYHEQIEALKENEDVEGAKHLKEIFIQKQQALMLSEGFPQDLNSVYILQVYSKLQALLDTWQGMLA